MTFYEVIEDITADTGIRVRGKDLKEIFCKAILATFNEITDIEKVEIEKEHMLEVNGEIPYILADVINGALVLFETKGFVARECHVLNLSDSNVKVLLKGGDFNPDKHESKLVIKAATYHRLKVKQQGTDYVAEVIFDI